MQLKLTFSEVEQMIASKAGQSIPLSYGGTHTLRISPEVNVLFKSTTIGLDISIDRIDGTNLYLSYSGGAGIEFMVRTALNKAKSQVGGDALELLDGNHLLFSLGKSQQLSPLFDKLELNDIYFDETSIIIDFRPKTY